MARKTRWAVAGTGGITARTLPDLALTENLEVVAVSSRTQPRADTFASEFGIPRSYGTYQAMLADPDVDLVYICTPNGSHFAMAAQAIQAGKHVLCEKPLTVNAAQASRLADLAQERNVFLMEAMWMKFNPAVQRLREIVNAGTIGTVRHITTGMGFPAPSTASRFWSAEQGGGALLDLGVYVITFAQMFLAEAGDITVSSVLGRVREDGGGHPRPRDADCGRGHRADRDFHRPHGHTYGIHRGDERIHRGRHALLGPERFRRLPARSRTRGSAADPNGDRHGGERLRPDAPRGQPGGSVGADRTPDSSALGHHRHAGAGR